VPDLETQEKILRTALQMFFKYGIRNVTMDAIARELGMSKKTIYQFCREKDELVYLLCDMELKEQEKSFDEFGKVAKDPVHEIMMISARLRQMFQNINPVFFIDLKKYYPEAYFRYSKFKEECAMRNLRSNIKRGIKLGIYRSDLDPEFTARYRMSQLDMMMFGDYFSYEKMSFATIHQSTLELFMYGICSIKGHKLINHYYKKEEE
jgi:TetR/AcrR family transcriptional regulator, cholesterol catabolism regulator